MGAQYFGKNAQTDASTEGLGTVLLEKEINLPEGLISKHVRTQLNWMQVQPQDSADLIFPKPYGDPDQHDAYDGQGVRLRVHSASFSDAHFTTANCKPDTTLNDEGTV